jgi:hypothetical protein
MFDSQCDIAALVYERNQDPDKVLRAFASDLKSRGYRVAGLVQTGHHCVDTPKLSAMLVHTGVVASGHVNRIKGRTHGCTDQCCKM